MDEFFIGCVDVRDVAQSLIVLYENPSAEGRHLCLESSERMVDFTDKLAELYPEFSVYRYVTHFFFGTPPFRRYSDTFFSH